MTEIEKFWIDEFSMVEVLNVGKKKVRVLKFPFPCREIPELKLADSALWLFPEHHSTRKNHHFLA